MRRLVRDNALAACFLLLFLLSLAGQSVAGTAAYNEDQVAEGGAPVTWLQYVTSSTFAVDVAENWQSEYLQFFLYILITVWLIQRGSPESKKRGEEGLESDAEQKVGRFAGAGSPAWAAAGGWRRTLFSHSLGLAMGLIFLLSWLAQSVAGLAAYDEERLARLEDPVGWGGYVMSAEFWNRTLQNWQSEFLAVASMVLLAIFLRERGSPQSKKVGDPHSATAPSG
ncbi:DUF6766 family protein [Microbispora triticiradicis]|uniref:Transmembrane protein n=2 Tax=Microbispora TaxID=2005 RepID=A0ABY3LPK5_9ACTN|nr:MULTISPECIES: DUF6766 family protein [Microbispora]TLP60807.1 hypothetical protein FED44_13150 [Microbispora fusca]TYB45067.1 hypothetical protein FXF59_32340 [Microbispora tritici]